MGFLCPNLSTSSLLCEESSESIFGFPDAEGEAPELGMDLVDLSSFADLSLNSNDVVGSLMEQEKEQLACIATGNYLERLNNGGIESSWRTAAVEWFGQVQAHYSFGPLCVYLAVNYLDRFLSSIVPDGKQWAQQVLSVACLSIAVKMEETVVPSCVDLQVCNVKHIFDAETIERMEVFVMISLSWRMRAVTPFSYISFFADQFNEGNPLTSECVSRCTELILGTLKATMFLQFKPSEIAAAVVLYTIGETKVFDFNSVLLASKIPVDKENVRKCNEAMQKVALVITNPSSVRPSAPGSPSDVLEASCFSFATDDSQTTGSEATNANNATSYQSCTPVSKRTRLNQTKMA